MKAVSVLCVLAVVVAQAAATTVRPLTDEELTAQANRIVVGRQVESRSVWLGRMLVTRVTVAVDETLKGDAALEVTVDIPGGIDINRRIPIGMSVPGAPSIASGEEVVLFLERRGDMTAQGRGDTYGIVGFSQGKLSVVKDAQGRQVVLRGGARGGTRLGEFRAKIQRHLTAPSALGRSAPRARPGIEED